ncbi:MAG TPA: hypothetical protein VGW34_01700 [Allosphingosinicella sp.]|nr:hypothetical protein [Allosphingosinicella sp.]
MNEADEAGEKPDPAAPPEHEKPILGCLTTGLLWAVLCLAALGILLNIFFWGWWWERTH